MRTRSRTRRTRLAIGLALVLGAAACTSGVEPWGGVLVTDGTVVGG